MKFKLVQGFFEKKHNEKIIFFIFCDQENQGLGMLIPRD
jgi:hypothetical protein